MQMFFEILSKPKIELSMIDQMIIQLPVLIIVLVVFIYVYIKGKRG